MTCHLCDSEDIVYTDVLDLAWCRDHYHSIYLGDSE